MGGLFEGLSREEAHEVYSRVHHVKNAPDSETAIKWAADSVRHEKRVKILERPASLSLLRPWRVEICTCNPLPAYFSLSDDMVQTEASIERRTFDNRSLLEAAKSGALTEGELCIIERTVERHLERAA